uniref:Defensin n=2 Tax=Phalotris mertensi TaxID=1260334 RepID=A0A182C5X6_9SAUR
MKILYLLFALLFLAFLSEPGNAQRICLGGRGFCHSTPCPRSTIDYGKKDCWGSLRCCEPKRPGK